MQPVLIRHPEVDQQTVIVQNEREPNFRFPWHYHPEMELTLIEEGEGTRFVGDSIERFEAEDMVLLGANVPHLWKSTDVYFEDGADLSSKAIVVHFHEGFQGTGFNQLPEAHFLEELSLKAQQGLRIRGQSHLKIKGVLGKMIRQTPYQRLLSVLEIMGILHVGNEYDLLASHAFKESYFERKNVRFNKVYNYILQHFQQPIPLSEVAAQANLSETAFCRFFKRHSGRSFSQLLKEIRISYACRLLIEKDYTVAQVAYHSGYNNLSNFNLHFRQLKGVSPREYQKQYELQTTE